MVPFWLGFSVFTVRIHVPQAGQPMATLQTEASAWLDARRLYTIQVSSATQVFSATVRTVSADPQPLVTAISPQKGWLSSLSSLVDRLPS